MFSRLTMWAKFLRRPGALDAGRVEEPCGDVSPLVLPSAKGDGRWNNNAAILDRRI
jgi:hypothetical protein